jgi:MFS family permease
MPVAPARALPRWRTDAFLAGAIALNYAARGILPVVLPALKADFHVSDARMGLLGSLFFWVYAICAPFGGYLGDLYSRRTLVLISVASWSAITLLTGFAPGWTVLLLLRIGFGMAESFYLSSATGLQADHHGPETRTRALGLNSLAQNIGPVGGAALAGWLAVRWGWRGAFVGLGLLGIALALGSPRLLSDAPVKRAKPPARATVGETLAYLFRDLTYLSLVLNEALSGLSVWIFFFWLPDYLYETYHVKMAAAGVAGMAMQQLSAVAGIAIGTWLSYRHPGMPPRFRHLLFALSCLISAPCLLCFLIHPSYLLVTVAIGVFSLLRGFGAVYELPVLCDVVPSAYRSTAVGLLIGGAMICGGLGIFVAGVLKASLGLAGVFAAMSAICALAGCGLLLAYWKFIERDLVRAEAWTAVRAD